MTGSRDAWWLAAFTLAMVMSLSARAAEVYGDVSVEANAIYSGNTYHGYAEMRVVVENHSPGKAHVVSLTFPNKSYGHYGNSISRLSRTVTVAPGTRQVVSMLQPPLPVQGDGSLSVDVDGRQEGEIHAPNANSHCNRYSRSGLAATIFISRSVDYDAVARVFRANHGAFTAGMAVGAPDSLSGGGGGYKSTTWMPDSGTGYRATNWLELGYKTSQTVDKIVVYNAESSSIGGFLVLIDDTGTNINRIPLASGTATSVGRGWALEYSNASNSVPVRMVRLNFEGTLPYNLAIDAVQITGPSGPQWASDARASSDSSTSAGSYSSGGGESVTSLRAEIAVADWSENWLAYSAFDAVVLSSVDLGMMSPAVLAALGDYLSAGGNVVLAGKTGLPAGWHPSQQKEFPGGIEYQTGFGRLLACRPQDLSLLTEDAGQLLRAAVRDAGLYWQGLPEESMTANSLMPVVENLKIPTRGIVVIMLVFVLVIGPVNIIYLNRRKRRTWMLWTIPAISLVTTLIVFAYSLLREGITPDTRIAGLTVLDQVSHRAATIGGTAFYCPLTPSRGLTFDFETEATPLVPVGYGGSGSAREVDWTRAQHFQHGWVSARVPAHFHLRKSETRRERIQITGADGKKQVVNGLGASIKSLWFADAQMNVYRAEKVPAGGTGLLVLAPPPAPIESAGPAALWRALGYAARPDSLNETAGKYLLPGTYIAVLDDNPFIENALGRAASPKRTKNSAIVFGILEPSVTP